MNLNKCFLFKASLLTLVAMSSGCATNGVLKERVAAVKTVAIIGYEVEEQKLPTPKASDAKFTMPTSMLTMPPRETKTATELYQSLKDVLKRELNWHVMDAAEVTQNQSYQTTQKEIAKLLMFQHGRKADWDAYLAKGVIPAKELDATEFKTKEALRRALGVDAIIIVENDVEMRKKASLVNLIGGSGFIPVSTLIFSVYDLKDEKPIWWDHKAEGEEVAEKTMKLGTIALNSSGQDLEHGPVVASEDAYRVLIERFKEAMKEEKK